MPARTRPNALRAINFRAYGRFARNVYRGARYTAARRAGGFGIGSTLAGRATNYLWNKASSFVRRGYRSNRPRRRRPTRTTVLGRSGRLHAPFKVGKFRRTGRSVKSYTYNSRRYTPKS